MRGVISPLPTSILAIGYTRSPGGFPLQTFARSVPAPAVDEVRVRVVSSSLNPLDYKLADLNFQGRTPPVALGFDFAGVVVDHGESVTQFQVGQPVFGMAPSNRDGVWAAGGSGGYVAAPAFMVARKPGHLSFKEAGTLGICFLSADFALTDNLRPGDSVYIPGGGGGVGHLAIQRARALGAGLIISSGGSASSRALAKACGADHVFDYRNDDVAAEIQQLTAGRGVDLVFDATYSDDSFIATAGMVRPGGRWVVLGVGPGKTTRTQETQSPVAGLLAEKMASLITVNLLRYFATPDALDSAARTRFAAAIQRATDPAIRPHVSAAIPSELDPINAALAEMREGRSQLGKVAVILDPQSAQ